MESYDISRRAALCRDDRMGQSRFISDMDPLIRKTASKYNGYYSEFSDDIYLAAQTGMFKALRNFDYSYHGFVKYACKSMEIEIRSFLTNESRLIRLPSNVSEKQRKIKDYISKNPSSNDDEIVRALGLSSSKSLRRIRNAEKAVSFDGLAPYMTAYDECSPESECCRSELSSEIENALLSLERSERYIVMHTFQLCGYEKKGLNDMARELGVSPQTVINRRNRALSKLRGKLIHLMT